MPPAPRRAVYFARRRMDRPPDGSGARLDNGYERELARIASMGGPLAGQLDAIAEAWRRFLPGYDAAVERFVGRLLQAGVGAECPAEGDILPDFVLPDTTGRLVHLSRLRRAGPVVVSFERGAWCPLCRSEMVALAAASPAVRAAGGEIVVLSPQRAVHGARLRAEAAADFHVVSDIGLAYTATLGLVVPLGEELGALYRASAIDLAGSTGDSGSLLPVPATFVIGRDGRIVARHLDPDPRRRMEPDAIIQAVAATGAAPAADGLFGSARS